MKHPVLLVVDDECDIKALYKTIVNKEFNFEIVEANSIKAAQNEIKNQRPDLVLLDLCLPDGDGFELIPQLKESNPKVQILVVTAFNHCQEKQKAKELGTYGLLCKPFEKETLVQYLGEMNKLR